jgi:hypothetical protein
MVLVADPKVAEVRLPVGVDPAHGDSLTLPAGAALLLQKAAVSATLANSPEGLV